MTIYLDLVVFLNFLVDFLLLLGTNRLAGFPIAPMRCVFSALLGGIYSGLALLHGFYFLNSSLWRILVFILIAGCAFGFDRSAIKRCGIFLLLSMALGGIAISLERKDIAALILAAGGIWLLCHIGFGATVGGREYIPLTLTYGEKTVSLIALRDSGNTLRDPITGERVFLIGNRAAEKLTGLSRTQLQHPMETLTSRVVPGLRLIPYQSIGASGGMLLAMRIDKVKLGEKTYPAIIAFSPDEIGNGDGYQALVTAE